MNTCNNPYIYIYIYVWPFWRCHRSAASIFVRDYRRLVYRILIRIRNRAQWPKIRYGRRNGNKKRILDRGRGFLEIRLIRNRLKDSHNRYRENGILVDNPESLDSPFKIYISYFEYIFQFLLSTDYYAMDFCANNSLRRIYHSF